MEAKIKFFPTLALVTVFIGFSCIAKAQSAEKVTIATDKTAYKSTINREDPYFQYIEVESMEITVINNLEKDIYFDAGFIIPFTSLYFEIYKDGHWQIYDEMHGVAKYPLDFTFKRWLETAIRVKPNEKFTFRKKPVIYRSDIKIFRGRYRLRLEYYPNCSPESPEIDSIDYGVFRSEKTPNCFAKIYSNEFIVE